MRLLYIAIVYGSCLGISSAAPPQDGAPSSLDDELFKGLDDATTAPGLKPKPSSTSTNAKPAESRPSTTTEPAPKPTSPKPTTPKPTSRASNPLDDELLKQLEGDDAAPTKPKAEQSTAGDDGENKPTTTKSDDPFVRLTEQIREAESRLRRIDSGDETQQLQKKIVDDLEKLIAQIEQQQQQQQQSKSQQQKSSDSKPQPAQSQPKPGQQPGGQERESSQASDSQEGSRSSTARKPDAGNLKSLLEKAWGTLPERERQAVMQTSVDDFPAKYQAVIEEYFKTLLRREE